ncbi:MAG: DUF167 family protein [Hyphomicrobiaceae bacterium]|jgi:uncharacterized protein
MADGLRISVRLTPRSAHDRVDGVEEAAAGPVLRVRVRAAPEHGAANAALTKVLAGWLGVPKTTVAVIQGAKSKVKILSVAGDRQHLANLASARLANEQAGIARRAR